MSNAALGREALRVVEKVTGEKVWDMFVNKTEKYVSVKLVTDNLTEEQKAEVTAELSRTQPDRFLAVNNGTATPGRMYMVGGECKWSTWKEPKVMVRFTQS